MTLDVLGFFYLSGRRFRMQGCVVWIIVSKA